LYTVEGATLGDRTTSWLTILEIFGGFGSPF
jgi:hypothetical protein